jgi:hypothetical protein
MITKVNGAVRLANNTLGDTKEPPPEGPQFSRLRRARDGLPLSVRMNLPVNLTRPDDDSTTRVIYSMKTANRFRRCTMTLFPG